MTGWGEKDRAGGTARTGGPAPADATSPSADDPFAEAPPLERELVALATDLARAAARLHVDGLRGDLRISTKSSATDLVSHIDQEAERLIVTRLAEARPGDGVFAEEGALREGGSGVRWVVDPLDGTTNFVHGFPAVGVSVALVDGAWVLAGAVHAPFLGDVWHAARGSGATWEPHGAACRVSERPPSQAIVATGFPFRRKERLPRYLRAMGAALGAFEDLRRPGAACLDLAWVACGVFDGFFELGLSAWDVAAGGLLIEEAGGMVTDWEGGPGWLEGHVLAGPPQVHAELARIGRA
jgi:myo-inositol-1(or 4)-monophosphatase